MENPEVKIKTIRANIMALAVEASSEAPARIVLAGAGNARLKRRHPVVRMALLPLAPIERKHVQVTNQIYRGVGDVPTDELTVPALFGVGPPDLTYALTREEIDKRVKIHEGRPIKLIGHSLGGFFAVRWVTEHPEATNVEAVAVASPFDKVNFLPIATPFFRKATERIRAQREALGKDARPVTLIGSEGDILIPTHSALPDLPESSQVIFTSDGQSAMKRGFEPVHVDDPPGHVEVFNHPEAVPFYEDTVVRPKLSIV